jgi:hypothetical protein
MGALVRQLLNKPDALLPHSKVERQCHDDQERIPFWTNYHRHYPYFADLVRHTVWHMLHRYGADHIRRDWIGLSDLLRDEGESRRRKPV